MANVTKLERMEMEIEKTKDSITNQQERLKILQQRLGKEKDKVVLQMVR